MYCCLDSEFDRNEMSLRSSTPESAASTTGKRAGRRPRRCAESAQQESRRQPPACSMILSLLEVQATCRAQMKQQQAEIDRLREQVQRLQALPYELYDGLAWCASGFGAIQNRLGEFHQERPENGLRYRGL